MSDAQIVKLIIGGILLFVLPLSACSTAAEETLIPPTHTPVPPTATATSIPPTETPVPPTNTPTPVPPTPTFTPFPAGQGIITLGSYQIEIIRVGILAGHVFADSATFNCGSGTQFVPLEPHPSLNMMTVSLRLVSGDLESFSGYVCQVLEPDGSLVEIETIQACEDGVSWYLRVPSTDPNLVVQCPDGGPIDLSPLVEVQTLN